MTRHLIGCVAVTMAVIGAAPAPVRAQQPPAGAASADGRSYLNLQPRRRMNQPPLFPTAPRLTPAQPQVAAGAPGRRVVCGMTIIPADPAVDPGIQARVAPRSTTPTMRVIEPPLCWEPSAPR